jgi:hypothetical protein
MGGNSPYLANFTSRDVSLRARRGWSLFTISKRPLETTRLFMMYKTGAVCAATGVPIPTLGRWHDRKTPKPSRWDKPSSGSGDHRLFSRATIDQIAIAKTLIDLGIAASPANNAAALFTELFPCGQTLLVITPTDARIVNAEFNATLTDFCGRPSVQPSSLIAVESSPQSITYSFQPRTNTSDFN